MTENWIILRTSAANTVKLARALEWAAYDVWTPVETRREREKYGAKKLVDRDMAILPNFIFVADHHLAEMFAIAHAPTSPYPAFSLFKHGDEYPLVPERTLTPLRKMEARLRELYERQCKRERHRGPIPRFKVGAVVRVADPAFAGLNLEVIGARGKLVRLLVKGSTFAIEISAWSLLEMALDATASVQLDDAQPEQAADRIGIGG